MSKSAINCGPSELLVGSDSFTPSAESSIPQLFGFVVAEQAAMFANATPGTWMTLFAPTPRMMLISDWNPTVL